MDGIDGIDGTAGPDPASEPASDDSDVGWGEAPGRAGERSDDWYRDERPPHHGD